MKRKNVVKGLVVLAAGLFLLSAPTVQAMPCAADITCNGRVGTDDIGVIIEEWMSMNCCPSTQCLNCEASGMKECKCWVGNGGLCVDNSTDEGNCGSCGNTSVPNPTKVTSKSHLM